MRAKTPIANVSVATATLLVLLACAALLAAAVSAPRVALADDAGGLAAGRADGPEPLQVQALDGDGLKAVQVSAEGRRSAVLMSNGSVWTLGSTPTQALDGVVQIATGGAYYCAVKADGSLWAWGDNSQGQLGDGTKTNRPAPVKVMDGVSQAVASSTSTAAIKSDGSLWVWGGGSSTPKKAMDDVIQVAVSGYTGSCAAVKSDRSLWTWKEGDMSWSRTSTSPEKVMDDVSQVSMDVWGDAFAAVKTDGSLWTWGANNVGLLGDGAVGAASSRDEPAKILDGVAQVDMGLDHGAAVKTDGTLWTWGNNDRGQLGDGTVADRYAPAKVMDGVASVSVGGQPYFLPGTSFTVAAKDDGTLWRWGTEADVHDDGPMEDKASPVCIFRDGQWLTGDAYYFADEVPERAALRDFLGELYWYDNDRSNSVSNREYDSTQASRYGDNIISNLIWHKGATAANLTGGTYPVDVFVGNGVNLTDPLGRFSEYLVCDGNAVKWMVENIFNVSDDDYAALRDAGDDPFWAKYYYYDGKYYVQTGGIGTLGKDIAVLSAVRDGDRYNVFFRIRYGERDFSTWDAGMTQNDSTYLYAQVGLKDVGGEDYWTLYKLSEYPIDSSRQVMRRLYNPYSGEHFYTGDYFEYRDVAKAGWADEGLGWNAPVSGDPVYRLYNQWGGEHHYTLDAAERDSLVALGWTDEGVGWRSAGEDGVPLYREYNPNELANNHNYTTDKAEHDTLVSLGWVDEGIAWYGV